MKNRITKIKILAGIILTLFLFSCEENTRFEIGYNDTDAPKPPVFLKYKPTYGGVRIFFEKPTDEDLLSIDAVYYTKSGEKRWFSVSYFTDNIDVYGFASKEPHTIELYSVDRAGNQSERLSIEVEPLEPAVEQVASTVYCVGGFSSFYVNWENGLMKSMNIFMDYEYEAAGTKQQKSLVYTSREAEVRKFVRDPLLSDQKVKIRVYIEDEYGNSSGTIDVGEIQLISDEKIPKDKWQLPEMNDSTIVNRAGEKVNTGIPMGFFNALEGRDYMAIDDIISDGTFVNFTHTYGTGRTGNSRDGNVPWNYIIDLGDYYELSRIITHQRYRHTEANEYSGREDYYRNENVGRYNIWRWDEETQAWDSITSHKILVPENIPDRQYRVLGRQGDMAYMNPDNPQFTKPTRWFRYEALSSFDNEYEGTNCNCLSEITLYGRKATGY